MDPVACGGRDLVTVLFLGLLDGGGDHRIHGILEITSTVDGPIPVRRNNSARCVILVARARPAIREPILHPVAIDDLCPTQITVGMREVEAKRKAWRAKEGDMGAEFLGRHLLPVILGPKRRYYVVDHHHLARVLHEEGVKNVLVAVVANLQRLEPDAFWFVLDSHSWMHPFDEEGRRRGYEHIPKSIEDLIDDPFRSLAGELRRVGGFAKDTTPFTEFLWADFLRRRMKRKAVETKFERTLEQALKLAKSGDADYLPGWCGAIAP